MSTKELKKPIYPTWIPKEGMDGEEIKVSDELDHVKKNPKHYEARMDELNSVKDSSAGEADRTAAAVAEEKERGEAALEAERDQSQLALSNLRRKFDIGHNEVVGELQKKGAAAVIAETRRCAGIAATFVETPDGKAISEAILAPVVPEVQAAGSGEQSGS